MAAPTNRTGVRHTVVYYDAAKWASVPANNGGCGPTWQWGDELLVGFTAGRHSTAQGGHQCDYREAFESRLARSTDGGQSWTAWKPEQYAGESRASQSPAGKLAFSRPGFVLRVEGNGYHGNSGCRWYHSADRGAHWKGPLDFDGLTAHPELRGREFTAARLHTFHGIQQGRSAGTRMCPLPVVGEMPLK